VADHMHSGFDMFLVIGFSSWLFLALMRILAAKLAQASGAIGSLGAALGGTL
jgi:hypothetical protein